jgi:lysophospholipase L1-like esterase
MGYSDIEWKDFHSGRFPAKRELARVGAMKHFHRIFRIFSLLLPLLAAAGAGAQPARAQWQTTWTASPQPAWDDGFPLPLGMPRQPQDVTLRQALRTSLGGQRLRVAVSNEYGRAPLAVGRLAVRIEGSAGPVLPLRFQGQDGVTVPPGARLWSDAVELPTRAGDRLELDLYLPGPAQLAGLHWDARERTLLLPGDAVGRPAPRDAQPLGARAFVTELRVEADRAPAAVVALGDSITDGNGATPGQDQRWPDHLARRLAPQGMAVLNAGISGNRLLRDGMGERALVRFERDVLGHPGVRAVIVLLGTNDIGWPGGPFAPHEPAAQLPALLRGFEQLVATAHARNVRVIGATLLPFERALEGTPLQGHHSPQKEALRQRLNAWIRDSGAFDAVVDFDAVLRDPSHPTRLAPAFDSGDHLHPGDAGYRAMAEAIDLSALLGGHVQEVRR